ncbi:MAG: glycosyltransferase family 2 protein [Anaerolineae bacterium]
MLFVLQVLYIVAFIPLLLASAASALLFVVYLVAKKSPYTSERLSEDAFPVVAVQLPLFNEQHVAERLVRAVAAFNYPCQKLHIQVLDDSTDDTTALLAPVIEDVRRQGIQIDLIHREKRVGYKGGALDNGLKLLPPEVEFVAIFDADFVPPADFLERTVPILVANPKIGLVQARWTHLNATQNLLTRAQAVIIDMHFIVEQSARARGGLLFSFNGTGGIWRRAAIESAGGWQWDTLTEDADLSLRAQLSGWQFAYLPDLAIPGELPPTLLAFKTQQARWARGTFQTFLKLARRIIAARSIPFQARLLGAQMLTAYASQGLGVLVMVLTVPLLLMGGISSSALALWSIFGTFVPMSFLAGQLMQSGAWVIRWLVAFPLVAVLSAGMTINNGFAAFAALRGKTGEFIRTPKFAAKSWVRSPYAQNRQPERFWEIFFGLYALIGMVVSLLHAPAWAGYFAIYAAGFLLVAIWGAWEMAQARTKTSSRA